MATMKHSTHSVTLQVPYAKAWAYLSDWRHQPEWGVNFVKGIRQEGEQIIMTTPFGDRPIGWRTHRDLGTIDVVFPGESVLPSRLTDMGDELLYIFTFSVPAHTSDEAFQAGQRGMEEELRTLKRILEV